MKNKKWYFANNKYLIEYKSMRSTRRRSTRRKTRTSRRRIRKKIKKTYKKRSHHLSRSGSYT